MCTENKRKSVCACRLTEIVIHTLRISRKSRTIKIIVELNMFSCNSITCSRLLESGFFLATTKCWEKKRKKINEIHFCFSRLICSFRFKKCTANKRLFVHRYSWDRNKQADDDEILYVCRWAQCALERTATIRYEARAWTTAKNHLQIKRIRTKNREGKKDKEPEPEHGNGKQSKATTLEHHCAANKSCLSVLHTLRYSVRNDIRL